jgi:hypothetical protein
MPFSIKERFATPRTIATSLLKEGIGSEATSNTPPTMKKKRLSVLNCHLENFVISLFFLHLW